EFGLVYAITLCLLIADTVCLPAPGSASRAHPGHRALRAPPAPLPRRMADKRTIGPPRRSHPAPPAPPPGCPSERGGLVLSCPCPAGSSRWGSLCYPPL